MPRRSTRESLSGALVSSDVHRFSHTAPASRQSHFINPRWAVVSPEGFDETVLCAASYWPVDRRRLVFRLSQPGCAFDLAQHRLVCDFRIPSRANTDYSSAAHPLYGSLPSQPWGTYDCEPRLADAVHLIDRIVVRSNRGAVVLDQSQFNVWAHARRWMDEPSPAHAALFAAATNVPVREGLFNHWDTTVEPAAVQQQYCDEGLRLVIRLEHGFFGPDSPLLLNPGELTIELYLAEPGTALTLQGPYLNNGEQAQYAGAAPTTATAATYQWLRRLDFFNEATSTNRDAAFAGRVHYELLNARFHWVVGELSPDFKARAASVLAAGLRSSFVGYRYQHYDVPRTELDTTILYGEATANVRRAFVVPRWLSVQADIEKDSFVFSACAINWLQWRYRGRYFPALPFESQDEIYEATAQELGGGDMVGLRLTRTEMLGARHALHPATAGAGSETAAPYYVWTAPRAFIIMHAFQDDAVEQSNLSAARSEGLSITPTVPLELRLKRATADATWPASGVNVSAYSFRSGVGRARWLPAQNNRGCLVAGDVTGAAVTNTAPTAATHRNSARADDTLRYTLFLDCTMELTQGAEGALLVRC